MPRKKSKISFDAMVKFFIQQYSIPSRKDIDKILKRLDYIEALIKETRCNPSHAVNLPVRNASMAPESFNKTKTATDTILDIIRQSPQGISFADIRSKSEFSEKKIRNILFRLDKMEKIRRKGRGIYIPSL